MSSTEPEPDGIPLLDLRALYQQFREEVEERVLSVMRSGEYILGEQVSQLEEKIAAYCGTQHAVGCASGSDALLLSLMALGVGPGDEVIVPTFTFFATAGAPARLGAKVVFTDIEPDTFNMDPESLKEAVSSSTKAVIPVHLFGQCAEMDPILVACEESGIPVIEDAAQAIGARYRERPAGSIGTMGCLSFFPTKNLGGFGDGGMILTNDGALAERLRSLRVHGASRRYHHSAVGINSRLDALQAAVLGVKLNYLDPWHEARRRNATLYDSLLSDCPVTRPHIHPHNVSVFNQYTLRVPHRDQCIAKLQEKGIRCAIYYPIPLHLQPCFSELGYKPGDFPNAEKAAQEVLSLPIGPELSADKIRFIAEAVAQIVEAIS